MDGCKSLGWNRGWMDRMDMDGSLHTWEYPSNSHQSDH